MTNFDPFFRSVPKKEPELLEVHVTRHLACAFVAFLDRQTSLENVAEDDVAQMNVAKEAIKKAFKLPEDDSLKVSFSSVVILKRGEKYLVKLYSLFLSI